MLDLEEIYAVPRNPMYFENLRFISGSVQKGCEQKSSQKERERQKCHKDISWGLEP